eukprot:COSAG02_NODE_188_length_30307_cov_341.858746_24_plen_385_part_00
MGARCCKCLDASSSLGRMDSEEIVDRETSVLVRQGVSVEIKHTHNIGKYLFNADEKPLGEGGYGKIYLAVNRHTGEEVALKLTKQGVGYQTPAELREVLLQKCLEHDNIVKVKDVVYDAVSLVCLPHQGRGQRQLGVLMEIMRGGELFDEVKSDGGFTEDKARGYFRDILFAMCYCHGKDVCHRDLKLENLLLTEDKGSCKVADFGLAKNVTAESARTVIGTAMYVSPEVLGGAKYDGFKADIWSCGVCLYCMVECKFPFSFAGKDGVGEHGQHRATRQNLHLMQQLKRAQYQLKGDYSPEFIEFLSRLLIVDVNARYTAAEALVDPWMLDRTWTKKKVLSKIDAMDTRSAPIPGDYTSRQEWVAKVEELCGAPTSSEDEDAGF